MILYAFEFRCAVLKGYLNHMVQGGISKVTVGFLICFRLTQK